MSLVNKDNSHTSAHVMSSKQGAVKGHVGIVKHGGKKHTMKKRGGKKHAMKKHTMKKRHGKKRAMKKRTMKKRGGAVLEPHFPTKGLKDILMRGKNASRGLSDAVMKVLKGGGYGMTAADAKMAGKHVPVSAYKNCGKAIQKGAGKKYRGRGGYKQYMSNTPFTPTMQAPAGSKMGKYEGQLATPPTIKSVNNCKDNYNHFTGKSVKI